MPLNCPRCRIAQAEENKTCINCGQPLTPPRAAPFADPALLAEADAVAHLADHDNPTAPDPVHAVQARRSSWQMPALVAVGLLLALAASALFVAPRKPAHHAALPTQTPRTAPVPPVPGVVNKTAVPAPPLAPATPAVRTTSAVGTKTTAGAAPLTITLRSTSEGRHVKVGTAVTLTALAYSRSATLTLFYRRGRGEKTMLSFVEGSLCSTTWTPSVPGRYEFTATALGDRRQAATSRRVEITVDRPARQTLTQSAAAQASPAVAAAPPPPRTASLPPPGRAPRTAARVKPPAPALIYHVAAAHFSFSRSAVVLADALSRRGYPAVPERMADPHGKTIYVVVTGSYRRPKEARKAALALQRSGYPAYFFGSR